MVELGPGAFYCGLCEGCFYTRFPSTALQEGFLWTYLVVLSLCHNILPEDPFPQLPWGREEGLGPGPSLTLGLSAFSLHLCAPLPQAPQLFLLKIVV